MSKRQQRKVEKKRQKRENDKRRERVRLARTGGPLERLIASASKAPFGPCAINDDWQEDGAPALVSLTVTRVLGNGLLLPSVALVDRTCLGVKDGFTRQPVAPSELSAELDELYMAHLGWETCEPLVAQSVLFHAVDYAARFGFKPHRDAALELFGPRPAALLETAWHAPARPFYMPGPRDNQQRIIAQLAEHVGAGGFDVVRLEHGDWAEEEWDEEGAEILDVEGVSVPALDGRSG